MGARVRALPIPGHAAEIGAAAGVLPDRSMRIYHDRDGCGWMGVELWTVGPQGGVSPVAILHPDQARALADLLVSEAARLELAHRAREAELRANE